MRAVLDTNLLISGLLKRGTPPDLLRRAWQHRRFTLVTSRRQLEELRRASRYPRLGKYLKRHEVGQLIGQLGRRAVVLERLPQVDLPPDPDDNFLLATAIAGKADYLVTGDKSDLLSLGKVEGVRVISARAFLELLE